MLLLLIFCQQLAGEKDRPAAGSDPFACAQVYDTFGTGLDVSKTTVEASSYEQLSRTNSLHAVSQFGLIGKHLTFAIMQAEDEPVAKISDAALKQLSLIHI